MTDLPRLLFDPAALILIIWSMALVVWSWRLGAAAREVAAQRREMRRWQRLSALHERQRWRGGRDGD